VVSTFPGQVVVTWQQTGAPVGIFIRAYDANTGSPLTDAFQVNTKGGAHPNIAIGPNNRFVVGWHALGRSTGAQDDSSGQGVYATIFSLSSQCP
jgi:hypothetical protein